MALILDESFATGIPVGFATALQQSGTLTATYNSGVQAVDLSNTTSGRNIWDISSAALLVAGEMEMDLEFVADTSGTLGFGGAWPVAGQAAVSNGFRFAHIGSNYESTTWAGSTSWAGSSSDKAFPQAGTLPFNTAGDRRTFNVRWDMSSGAGISRLSAEFRVDGNLVLTSLSVFPSLRPGITLAQSTVRLHSLKVWDTPQAPLAALVTHGLTGVGLARFDPPGAQATGAVIVKTQWSELGRAGTSLPSVWGYGQIVGTVMEKTAPANTPLRRRVLLIDEASKTVVAETWSNAVTGAYVFQHLSVSRTFTVLAYDHARAYRAVIADNLSPELPP